MLKYLIDLLKDSVVSLPSPERRFDTYFMFHTKTTTEKKHLDLFHWWQPD